MEWEIPQDIWAEMQAVDLTDQTFAPENMLSAEDVIIDTLSPNLQRLYIVQRRARSEGYKVEQELEGLGHRRDAIMRKSRGRQKLPAVEEARYLELEKVYCKGTDTSVLFWMYLKAIFSRTMCQKKSSEGFRVIRDYLLVLSPIKPTVLTLS